ncbi:aldose 1-epimerase family protein [Puniceibacterium sediminis]|uniref:Galactose mutarotase n=1 Tax=Puniceibacterium sediminis TaxID=1608407 RepID=A0A238UT19_9RHOB|nr:aldose 1-epimerase family protein [Puniceibacterium sediminis]SNR24837.1 Galactose mutarotase [Puniceibacterium sediminis]
MTDNLTRIQSSDLSMTITDLGAEAQSLRTADGRELLWHGDAKWWGGRAPVLFPIVGRAPDNRIAVGGFQAEMAQHGFARRSVFTLEENGPGMCRHVLRDTEATRAVYPFSFALRITHRLEGLELTVSAEVENCSDVEMPFGFGFHPAFRWPLPGCDGQPHEVVLDNGGEPEMARLEGGLLSESLLPSPFHGGRLELRPEQFAEDAMVFPEGAGTGLRYGMAGGAQLAFRFENLPNLALWSKPGAPFLCIEPWHGMAARVGASHQISERPYSQTLAPGGVARFSWSVEVRL